MKLEMAGGVSADEAERISREIHLALSRFGRLIRRALVRPGAREGGVECRLVLQMEAGGGIEAVGLAPTLPAASRQAAAAAARTIDRRLSSFGERLAGVGWRK